MKRAKWVRLIAMILVISMLAAPVSAATVGGSGHFTNGLIGSIIGIIKDIIIEIIDDWFDIPGVGDPDPTEPPVPTTPEEPTAPSEPVVTDPTEPEVTEPEETEPEVTEPEVTEPEAPVFEQTLVEGHANTVNGNLLRGVTYTLSQLVAQEPQTAPYALRSSPVSTLADEGTTGGGNSEFIEAEKEVFTNWVDGGQYYIQCSRAFTTPVASWLAVENGGIVGVADTSSATPFTLTITKTGDYYLSATIDGAVKYLTFTGSSVNGDSFTDTPVALTIEHMTNSDNSVTNDGNLLQIGYNGNYLNQNGSKTALVYGAYDTSGDMGNAMWMYLIDGSETKKVEVETVPVTVKVVYFPVTMFNYDMDTMNDMTNSMYAEGSTLKDGIHFSNGTPADKSSVTYAQTAHTGEYTNGQYVIQNYLMKDYSQPSWLSFRLDGDKGIIANADQADAAIWTLTRVPGANNFTLTTELDGTTYYMTLGNETSGVTTEYSEITLVYYTHTNAGIQITKDGYYLGHSEGNLFCGNTNSTSTSNGMGFFPVAADGTIGTTARNVTTINGRVTSGFSRWNWWSYLEDNNAAQNKFFAELVQHELDENGDIVFNVIEPGIFKTGTGEKIAQKDVYTNVGLPFVLNEYGYYTFDSDDNGVYFNGTPASGTKENPHLMTFDYDKPQGWEGMKYGDGSTNLWAPFNTNANDTSEGAIDYHFGMRADIPFSMTPNGCIKSTDNNSDHITFTFAGDDDVWIFIDGHLVIDLGGIHNRIGATIDFAANTITYFLPESNNSTAELGCYNDRTRYPVVVDENGKQTITVQLYNEANTEGALGKTRTDFASQEEHHMTIFYLERGKGTSNCKIEFNMPMRDTLLVTKDATMSWSEKQDENDGDGTSPLTAKEQAAVNNILFGFTLYKKEANATGFTPVANTNYFVQDQNDVVVDSDHTDANGHFYLKNGETAKFMTDFPKEGVTYYVVEDKTPDGFLTPDFQFKGKATNGFDWYDAEDKKQDPISDASVIPEQEIPMPEEQEDGTLVWPEENKSYTITAYGSVEAIDSLEFICVNYLDETLPNPTALAYEDMIVIDYGLPVHIDPMANDIHRGDIMEIVAWGDESLTLNEVLDQYGNAVPHDADAQNKTSWSGTQNFHSGKVTFLDDAASIAKYGRQTFKYELNKQLTEVEVISYIIKVTSSLKTEVTHETKTACRYALAKVYIAPATIMYYEENFNNLVHFTFLNGATAPTFEKKEAYISDYQEPGVVGDRNDSTYGSDVAYLSDPHDSNGTSFFFDTTNGAVRFWYTFTGTGTSFFARTSATTGYMQVLLFAGDQPGSAGQQLNTYYRDTYFYKGEDDHTKTHDDEPLYNIPVYTTEPLPYGTYTVLVTVAKKGTKAAGPVHSDGFKRSMHEFYLDGIRVMQPLDGVYRNRKDMEPDEYGTISGLIPIPDKDRTPITNKALDAYTTDNESNLDIVTLRNKLIDENYFPVDPESGKVEEAWPFVVLTDTNGEIIYASDYVSIGPKEEVYLKPGQKVRFSLKYWQPEGLSLYIGMKAPFGNGALVNVGNTPYSIGNAADCYRDVTKSYASQELIDPKDGSQPYYVITYTFEVPETASEVVALTNIKVVGSHEFTILENEEVYQ